MPVPIAGVLAVGAALALTCCAPLNGADPLDSGELATAAMEVVPLSADWEQERRLQDERVQRLSEDREDGSTTRGSAGIDASADF